MLSDDELTEATGDLATLPYFPMGDGAQDVVAKHLCKIVETSDQLRWLIDTYVAKAGRWGGVAELRALYSTRWKPLDGIEGGDCQIVGHTPSDSESQTLEEHSKQKSLAAPANLGGALKKLH